MCPSEFGEATWDEFNIIEPGGNYGWPHYEGAGGDPNYIDPVQQWISAQALSKSTTTPSTWWRYVTNASGKSHSTASTRQRIILLGNSDDYAMSPPSRTDRRGY
ncbi:hypothetical protein GCM10023190_22640 [Enteractinococcus fodinae]|uniref:Glucose/arabinose dehydrogenase n=2 Tax=Enteractinococcus fodinae TaxID=684663 RepID=A0ABU2B308_9MICC|nr:glucose/arabinose dehydrogenase [Enteractinococcus fodinae]